MRPRLAASASARSEHVAFIIASAASGVSTPDAEIFSLENSMRVNRLGDAEARTARAYARALVDAAYLGAPRATLDSLVAVGRGQPWFFEPPGPTHHYWSFSPRIAGYDPLALWRQVRVPVLLLYGDADERVPPRVSAARIAAALAESGNPFVDRADIPRGRPHLSRAAQRERPLRLA